MIDFKRVVAMVVVVILGRVVVLRWFLGQAKVVALDV